MPAAADLANGSACGLISDVVQLSWELAPSACLAALLLLQAPTSCVVHKSMCVLVNIALPSLAVQLGPKKPPPTSSQGCLSSCEVLGRMRGSFCRHCRMKSSAPRDTRPDGMLTSSSMMPCHTQ